MSNPLFCVDCKHYRYNPNGRWDYETHLCDYQQETDLVTGKRRTIQLSARIARENPEKCGPEGKWFERK